MYRLGIHNATWACFDCRASVRRPNDPAKVVPCPNCGQSCRCLGTRWRIPSKSDERSWRKMREHFASMAIERARTRELARLERRRWLERQIARIESRPTHPARERSLNLLRSQLAAV